MLGRGIRGANILALTFTNKAAGEMKERIETLVPRSGVWVGTFHGLCARLLRSYAPLVGIDRGFTIYDQSDRLRAVKDAMERLELEDAAVTPERIDSTISKAKNDLVTPEMMAKKAGDHVQAVTAKVYARYQERLKAASAVDFDDLLVHLVTILKKHPDVRAELDARFRYVLVDEYQDTNLAQYAIIRALCVDRPNLCVTGDPDQSIYGWRGANLKNILEFEHDFPGCKVVKLERNYRSTKNILLVADTLIRHNVKRKAKALITENPQGQPVELTIYGTESEEAHGVASQIVGLVREGDFAYRDVAVFCRVTALTRGLEQAFRDGQDPLSGRRRGLVLRASGDQGCPFLLKLDGQSQERRRVRPGRQCSASRDRQDDSGQAQGAGRGAGHPAPGDGPPGVGRAWPEGSRRAVAPRLRDAHGRIGGPPRSHGRRGDPQGS